jgi:hypothetical protein
LFAETQNTYRVVDGHDPDWPSWYAQRLLERFG